MSSVENNVAPGIGQTIYSGLQTGGNIALSGLSWGKDKTWEYLSWGGSQCGSIANSIWEFGSDGLAKVWTVAKPYVKPHAEQIGARFWENKNGIATGVALSLGTMFVVTRFIRKPAEAPTDRPKAEAPIVPSNTQQTQIDKATQAFDNLRRDTANVALHSGELVETFHATLREAQKAQKENATLTAQLNETKTAKANADAEVLKLQGQINNLTAESEKIKLELKNVKDGSILLNQDTTTLTLQKTEVEAKLQTKINEIAVLTTQKNKAETNAETLQTTIDQTSEKLRTTKDALDVANAAALKAEQDKIDLNTLLTKTEKELAELVKTHKNIAETNKTLLENNSNVMMQLQNKDDRIMALETELTTQKDLLKTLTLNQKEDPQIADLKETVIRYQGIEETYDKLAKKADVAENAKQALEQENAKLKMELEKEIQLKLELKKTISDPVPNVITVVDGKTEVDAAPVENNPKPTTADANNNVATTNVTTTA